MKRKGLYRPTVEDAIELSGIEALHPGGFELTRRTAGVAGLRPGLDVLDVSSGRGTQAVYYAQEFHANVTGIDISEEMVQAAAGRASRAGVSDRTRFLFGDSQALPFGDESFDVAINECAVGIPEDSQRVLDEMVRVVRRNGAIVIHESTWRAPMDDAEKEELSERYGTTPLTAPEWIEMLERAGAEHVESEVEPWSVPSRFWEIRMDRDVPSHRKVLTLRERLRTVRRIAARYGLRGVLTALTNERIFYRAVLDGKLGYGLYWGRRPEAAAAGRAPSAVPHTGGS